MNSIHYEYIINGNDFSHAGEASTDFKRKLKQLNIPAQIIRRVTIAMYEGEINMVIHADGGRIDTYINPDEIRMVLADHGPGIADIDLAMQAGYSTATEEIQAMGFGAGMGLPNMKQSSDHMQIETELNKGTTITMSIDLTPLQEKS